MTLKFNSIISLELVNSTINTNYRIIFCKIKWRWKGNEGIVQCNWSRVWQNQLKQMLNLDKSL